MILKLVKVKHFLLQTVQDNTYPLSLSQHFPVVPAIFPTKLTSHNIGLRNLNTQPIALKTRKDIGGIILLLT
jgi:hypothetical protein